MPRRLPFSFYPFSIVLFWSACCSAQMAVFSELYLGPDHELFNAFPITSFEEGVLTVDRGGGVFTFGPDSNWENAIFVNDKLENITGLEGLSEISCSLNISGNNNLVSLSGLNSLKNVDYISIYYNDELQDFCSLKDVVDSNNFYITGNKFNPTWSDFSNNNCSN